VAAGDQALWADNLFADPTVEVEVGERRFMAIAEPLEGADHARVVRGLILRYGTPAERLGRGPTFRLRPLAELGASG
jgi:F420H(2)-dependent quinone reductase